MGEEAHHEDVGQPEQKEQAEQPEQKEQDPRGLLSSVEKFFHWFKFGSTKEAQGHDKPHDVQALNLAARSPLREASFFDKWIPQGTPFMGNWEHNVDQFAPQMEHFAPKNLEGGDMPWFFSEEPTSLAAQAPAPAA